MRRELLRASRPRGLAPAGQTILTELGGACQRACRCCWAGRPSMRWTEWAGSPVYSGGPACLRRCCPNTNLPAWSTMATGLSGGSGEGASWPEWPHRRHREPGGPCRGTADAGPGSRCQAGPRRAGGEVRCYKGHIDAVLSVGSQPTAVGLSPAARTGPPVCGSWPLAANCTPSNGMGQKSDTWRSRPMAVSVWRVPATKSTSGTWKTGMWPTLSKGTNSGEGPGVRSGRRACIQFGTDNGLLQWDVKTGKVIRHVGKGQSVWSMAISTDARLALFSRFGEANLWDVEKGASIRSFPCPNEQVWQVGFSRDGKRAFSWSHNNEAPQHPHFRVWEVESGKQLFELDEHGVAALSPDGSQFLFAKARPLTLQPT